MVWGEEGVNLEAETPGRLQKVFISLEEKSLMDWKECWSGRRPVPLASFMFKQFFTVLCCLVEILRLDFGS